MPTLRRVSSLGARDIADRRVQADCRLAVCTATKREEVIDLLLVTRLSSVKRRARILCKLLASCLV